MQRRIAATLSRGLTARLRHQRQQEAGRNHEAEHGDDDREDLRRRGQPAGMSLRTSGAAATKRMPSMAV